MMTTCSVLYPFKANDLQKAQFNLMTKLVWFLQQNKKYLWLPIMIYTHTYMHTYRLYIYIYTQYVNTAQFFKVISNHADLSYTLIQRYSPLLLAYLVYCPLYFLLMHSLPSNPSSNIPFWPYSSRPSPLSFSFSLPPFLSLPLSGKSHGFPEVEHHKAWSAGGSLPSFILMLCLSSLLIGRDSVMWHFVR